MALNRNREIIRALVFLVALVTIFIMAYGAYSLGFQRGFNFDDEHNLVGLAEVLATNDWRGFVFDGNAGPLGRPLALASFAAQAYAWPNNPEVFLHVNTCIHLINACLVTWLAWIFGAKALSKQSLVPLFALSVGGIWCLHPLLASTNLFVVQRMASLSALFVFSGIIMYIKIMDAGIFCRAKWIVLVVVIALFTVLAALAKETGALLFLFAWIINKTICRKSWAKIAEPYWVGVVIFWVPLVALLIYTLTKDYAAGYALRDFTMGQRLLTEFRILNDYARLIFFPERELFGPYHDDYVVSQGLFSPVTTFVSIVALVLAIVAAVRVRKSIPVVAFGILWFFGAHLLESSVFPLELYFEHRNYIASFGLVCIFVWLVLDKLGQFKVLVHATIFAYVALIYYVLLGTTVVWGDRELASGLWIKAHPDSERAIQDAADYKAIQGKPTEGLNLLSSYRDSHPDNIGVAFQVAYMDMVLGGDVSDRLSYLTSPEIIYNFKTGRPSIMVCQVLDEMEKGRVVDIDSKNNREKIFVLLNALAENPRVSRSTEVNYCLHRYLASMYLQERDLNGVMVNLEAAYKAYPQLGMALQLVDFPAKAGLYALALDNAEMVKPYFPANPVLAKEWRRDLDSLVQKINSQAYPDGVSKR